jgi:transcriptional regulator GlxA family with amidase domain
LSSRTAPLSHCTAWRILLERFFLDRLPSCPPLDLKIQRAVAMITQSKGQLRIEELARAVDVSKRSLERYFLKHVGLSPKAISQIIRLRQAIEEILHGSEVNLGEVAFKLGFYDRSHLFNEIKDMMGKAPSAVAQSVDLKWKIFVTKKGDGRPEEGRPEKAYR